MTTALAPDRPAAPDATADGSSDATATIPTGEPVSPWSGGGDRSRIDRLVFGPSAQPRWVRPSLFGLLAATAVLYLVGLSMSGYANEFYAAAVQAGTKSLKAWLFGSLDAGNSITVDKPPASLWVMVLSARLLGFSSFAMLLPQALMGVGTVALTYLSVKRWVGPAAGLVAGALVAATPVAALMFRFNNPDALLVLLMTAAAYLVVRAVDASRDHPERPRRALAWLCWAGVAIGFAFLTKMFQGLLVLPAMALVYLVAASYPLRRRILHLFAGLAGVVVGAGWFVALVSLWPADSRPYIGGSTNNSLWELALGYNGLGRIFGSSGNGGGAAGGGQNAGFGGATGLGRLFNSAFGTEISWFLPAALLGLVAVLALTWRAERTDRTRAALVLWGGSLVVSGLVFSSMEGTVHPYYAVALAPSIAATVAVAGTYLWRKRGRLVARLVLGGMIAATAVWSYVLLGTYASGWLPWLHYVVLVGGLAGAVGVAVAGVRMRRLAAVALLVGSLSAAGGSLGYTVATATQAHSGSIPTSGPSGYSSGMGGGMGGGGQGGGPSGGMGGGQAPSGQAPGQAQGSSGTASGGSSSSTGTADDSASSSTDSGSTDSASTSTDNSASSVSDLLSATTSTWSAAVIGSQTAAGYELSSNTSVMAIGGWDGSDPSITLAQFQQDVSAGKIHYFIASGQGGGGAGGQGGSSTVASQITSWVEANYTATTVGGTTVYDLTAATTSS